MSVTLEKRVAYLYEAATACLQSTVCACEKSNELQAGPTLEKRTYEKREADEKGGRWTREKGTRLDAMEKKAEGLETRGWNSGMGFEFVGWQ